MEQPKKQELESLVEVLEERRTAAKDNQVGNYLEAAVLGAFTGYAVYMSGFFQPVSGEVKLGVGAFFYVVSVLGGIATLVCVAKGVLDYHHIQTLGDKIAEIKHSPEYKAQQGSGQKG